MIIRMLYFMNIIIAPFINGMYSVAMCLWTFLIT